MGAAVDIGVIRDHVSPFTGIFGTPVMIFGSEVIYKGTAHHRSAAPQRRGPGGLDDFVSQFFCLGQEPTV